MKKEEQMELPIVSKKICVCLSAIEYKQVLKESNKTGRSVPSLLRDSFFNRLPTKFLLKPEQGERLIKEVNKVGVNINQIARKVNAGVGYGWNESIQRYYDSLDAIKRMCMGAYG